MSINRRIDKEDMIHIYNGILTVTEKKIMPFAATWMDLEIVILSEESQRRRKIIRHSFYKEFKKK